MNNWKMNIRKMKMNMRKMKMNRWENISLMRANHETKMEWTLKMKERYD